MEAMIQLLTILIPAGLVLYGMYLVVRSFLQKEFERNLLEIKNKSIEVALPIRLQAYERMTLYLERISPNNLVLRLNRQGLSAQEFRQILEQEVREELSHNYSQQVYMSDICWQNIKNATDEVQSLIQEAFSSLSADASGIELGKAIFQKAIEKNASASQAALIELKKEVRGIY